MNIKTLAVNGIVAALYIAVSFVVQPFGFTNVQFRVSEMFNHLIVFNKKYIYGIVLGVLLNQPCSFHLWFLMISYLGRWAIDSGPVNYDLFDTLY